MKAIVTTTLNGLITRCSHSKACGLLVSKDKSLGDMQELHGKGIQQIDQFSQRIRELEQCFNECEVARVAEYQRAEKAEATVEELKLEILRLRRHHNLSATEQL
jgi:oligoendopeptidase F